MVLGWEWGICTKNSFFDLDKHTRKKVAEITQHKLPQPLAKAILPHNSRLSQFYGLPKDHKPGLPLRPVVSTCGSSMDNVSLLLERILNQLLKFVPAHLTSTKECIDVLSDVGVLPDDCIIASLDVVSLYSNIPVVESIDVVMEFLELHRKEVDMFHLSLSDVRELLSVVLSSNYFEFDGVQYRQRKGLAMGNHLAPPMAIIFMSKLESEAMAMFPWKPRLYRRYIDDCLVVWCHGLVKLMEFVQYLSSRHPDIRFTVEHTQQNVSPTVSYLDLSISVASGVVQWELFVKPSHSVVHLSYESSLPLGVKRSVAQEQFRRANSNASTDRGRERGEKKIETLLRDNDYPQHAIQAAKHHASTPRPSSTRQRQQSYTSIIKLPFVNDRLARDVRRTVRSFSKDVRVVFQSGRSLRDMLVSSSLSRPECPKEVYKKRRGRGRPVECRACDAGMESGQCLSQDVIYSMLCALCAEEYVGETERTARKRFEEHCREAKAQALETPWGEHYAEHHPQQAITSTPITNASILAKQSSLVNRRIREAMFIRDKRPSVNRDRGWRLLDTV